MPLESRLFDLFTVNLVGVYYYILHVINIHADIASYWRELFLLIHNIYILFIMLFWTKYLLSPRYNLVEYIVLFLVLILKFMTDFNFDHFSS